MPDQDPESVEEMETNVPEEPSDAWSGDRGAGGIEEGEEEKEEEEEEMEIERFMTVGLSGIDSNIFTFFNVSVCDNTTLYCNL